jgi:hypothetical protein
MERANQALSAKNDQFPTMQGHPKMAGTGKLGGQKNSRRTGDFRGAKKCSERAVGNCAGGGGHAQRRNGRGRQKAMRRQIITRQGTAARPKMHAGHSAENEHTDSCGGIAAHPALEPMRWRGVMAQNRRSGQKNGAGKV